MKAIFIFYRNFLVPSVVISVMIAAVIDHRSPSVLMTTFLVKLVTSGFLGLFFWFLRSDEFYFFENLGFTKRRLYAGALAFDLAVWAFVTWVPVLLHDLKSSLVP